MQATVLADSLAVRDLRFRDLNGTIPEEIAGDDRVHNTSVVVDADGNVAGLYRKIHLFDVDLPGASLQEEAGLAEVLLIVGSAIDVSAPPPPPMTEDPAAAEEVPVGAAPVPESCG